MKELSRKTVTAKLRPERIIQFGEGNFLRAFADWIVWNMNEKTISNTTEAGIIFDPDNQFDDRPAGSVGIRNEIWIIPTVGCVNGIANKLAEEFRHETNGYGVDAIVAYQHNYGCSQLGDDHENTLNILRNMVLHPNAGGVLVVGLGCENNQPDAFRESLGQYDTERIKFLVTQKVNDEH